MDTKQRIRAIIDSRKDLSVRNVSLGAGLSDSALHKFLNNDDQSMTIDNLQKVADAMDVTLRALLFDEDSAEIVDIWDRIPDRDRSHAKDILLTFAKRGGRYV